MGSSRIAANLTAARVRLGWSRETLAHHSGVSWSAIVQIESGRRKDVRLSSLSALANALGVSVDYMIGSAAAATTPQLFEHRALTYRTDEEFTAGAVPFLEEGIEQSHCVIAVLTEHKAALLRSSLGDRAAVVEFADWPDWYSSPANAVKRYGEVLKQNVESGAVWIRVVAEAAWHGCTDAEMVAWARYESLVNVMFAASPVTIMCTYDERASPDFIHNALLTHPQLTAGPNTGASPSYRQPEDFLLDAR
ncbi:MAG TPA: MEDS domain-containing protein [Ilumatobacteraceae bacterium]